jgi:hypothetical protein
MLRNAYRVFWGGGYGVLTLIVTITQTQREWRASVTEFVPFTGTERYQVAKRAERAVAAQEIVGIRRALQAGAFWTDPVWQEMEGEGTVWMIEARENGDHRAVTRVQPAPALAEAARLVLKAAGVAVPADMSVPPQ